MTIANFLYSLTDKTLQNIIQTLSIKDEKLFKEFTLNMLSERIKFIPEALVVDAIKEYIDGAWSSLSEKQRLWNNVMNSIKELDEGELTRILHMQEKLNHRYKKVG